MLQVVSQVLAFLLYVFGEKKVIELILTIRRFYNVELDKKLKVKCDEEYNKKLFEWNDYLKDRS